MDFSFDIKERIRDAVDIVDLVSRYVPSLRRQGRGYVGRCPWHDDSRPSLQVNPERQFFKCWVCDIGGDIFSFVMKMEGVGFREALEILADIAGIPLPASKPFRKTRGPSDDLFLSDSAFAEASPVSSFAQESVTKPVLYRAMDWLCSCYHHFFLNDPEAEEARRYIKDRGINDEMIRRFRIGYSPMRPGTVMQLIGADRNRVAILEAAGILARSVDSLIPEDFSRTPILSSIEADQYYDRFRGRVLFPIRDTQDRTVAFGGRLLPNTTLKSPAKYVNSPETPIFTKSKMLYGLDLARNSIRKKKRVIITEGYTDCLMAHQFGFDETVAVLGTALGDNHVRILNRFADKIYLILDGDEAGRKRTDEVLNLFVSQGADMSILTLPNNMDPCEYLLAEGGGAFESLIENQSVDVLEHAFQSATSGIDLEHDLVASARALDRLTSIIALYPTTSKTPGDPTRIRVAKMVARLAARFRISEGEVRRSLSEHRRVAKQQERDSDSRSQQSKNENLDQSAFVLPVSEFSDTEDQLLERFGRIPKDIWKEKRLLPNSLEREFLQFWMTFPEQFRTLSTQIDSGDFFSPVTLQLETLGKDLQDRGILPDFSQLFLRYDDSAMKNFLIGIDQEAREKRLKEQLSSEQEKQLFLDEIIRGFERQRIASDTPKALSVLSEEDLTQDKKLSQLLKLQEQLRRRQEQLGSNTLMDGSEPTP